MKYARNVFILIDIMKIASTGHRNVGGFLRLSRLRLGISLNELARRSNVSAAEISRIERGRRLKVGPQVLRRLAEPLQVPYEALLLRAGYLEGRSMRDEDALIRKMQLLSAEQRRMVESLLDMMLGG